MHTLLVVWRFQPLKRSSACWGSARRCWAAARHLERELEHLPSRSDLRQLFASRSMVSGTSLSGTPLGSSLKPSTFSRYDFARHSRHPPGAQPPLLAALACTLRPRETLPRRLALTPHLHPRSSRQWRANGLDRQSPRSPCTTWHSLPPSISCTRNALIAA